jgi:hypothetical protein
VSTTRSSSCALVILIAAALCGSLVLADGGPQHQVKQTPPVKMGTSGGSANDIGNAFCCGGTLGSLVNYNGSIHILSNNHILARSGSAVAGEDTIQPGLIDSSCQAAGDNIVGDFIGNVVPLGSNVDAALSLARAGTVDTTGAILDVGVPCSLPLAAAVNMPIMKSGRTTGCANGTVQSVNTNLSIQYQVGCNQGKKFKISYTNQIATTNISAGGDSGSLILSQSGVRPVALLYAGSSTTTIGNPIQDVINAFGGGSNFSFVGSGTCNRSFTCPASGGGPPAAISPSAFGVGPSASDVDFARRIKEAHEPALFARAEVLGAGVGADDADPTQAVIVIYVETGKAGARSHGLPSEINGIKVKVISTDPFVAF